MKQKASKSKFKKIARIGTGSFLLLLVVLVLSNPSKNQFEDWFYENYGYQCNEYGECEKDNTEVLVMGEHYRNAGIFMSVERTVERPDSTNGETETIRAFGIFNNIYTVEDNGFSKRVNE